MNPSHGSRPYPPSKANEPALTPRSNVSLSSAVAPRPGGGGNGGGRGFSGNTELDARLVRGMKAGDENALGEFYDRWFPVVNCLTTRMLKSLTDVEAVVEETFWQAWRQADRFDHERGSVHTWLLTMARSRALDRLRTTRRLREDSIDETPIVDTAAAALPTADPSLAVEHAERKRLVLAALADLPREQRDALELGYFDGLSQTEIAHRTGIPLGAIKTRIRLAMLELRDRLSPLHEDAR
jgi:RNA polymerase sigma-70 factor, ECF subfamily